VTFSGALISSTKFTQTNNCGVVAAGRRCTFYVTYRSSNAGSDAATMTVTSSAPNSPSVISLAGPSTGTTTTTTTSGSGITVSASALVFGTAQSTQSVTYTNNTSSTVTFIQASMSSTKFGQTNNCGEVAPGASCTANVTYYPSYGGSNTGTFTMTSSAPNSPTVVSLSGA